MRQTVAPDVDRLRGVAAMLFDLDNTLFDRDMAVAHWAEEFIHSRLMIAQQNQRDVALRFVLSLDDHGYGAKPAMFAAIKEAYPVVNDSVDHLVEDFYRTVPTYSSLDAGAAYLLDALEAARMPFGIVTNGTAYQLETIRGLGLDARAACAVVSEVIGCRKPNPAIFLHAAARLHVLPQAVLFVGDNAEADMWGAYRVGMRTARLYRGQPWPAVLGDCCADVTISSLRELLPIVGC